MSVQILLSTFNGENYIKEQLESMIAQRYQDFSILVRDDGSSDRTTEILESYASNFEFITLLKGSNLGVVKSFFELLNHADLAFTHFALADQDDWWLPDKLKSAVEKLPADADSLPALYCGAKTIVDENLVLIDTEVKDAVHTISFGNALVQNICTGCTCVFNRSLLEIIRFSDPRFIIMHDWWIYLAASCYGKVYYDVQSYILYRQHNNNASSAIFTQKKLLKYRMSQLAKKRGQIYRQANSFQTQFQLPPDKDELVKEFLFSQRSWLYRIKIISNSKIFRQKHSDNLILKLIILLGKL